MTAFSSWGGSHRTTEAMLKSWTILTLLSLHFLLLSHPSSLSRWALWAVIPLRPLCTWSLQERWLLCQPAGGRVQMRVSIGWLWEALLWDDHSQLPSTLLPNLQGPPPALSLHPFSHVSTSAWQAASPAPLHRVAEIWFIHPHILPLHAPSLCWSALPLLTLM